VGYSDIYQEPLANNLNKKKTKGLHSQKTKQNKQQACSQFFFLRIRNINIYIQADAKSSRDNLSLGQEPKIF